MAKTKKDNEKVEDSNKAIRDRIIDALSIYPVVSPSMLQTKIGPALPSSIWRPVLDVMIEEGVVVKTTETHTLSSGREQSFTKLKLATSKNSKDGLRVLDRS